MTEARQANSLSYVFELYVRQAVSLSTGKTISPSASSAALGGVFWFWFRFPSPGCRFLLCGWVIGFRCFCASLFEVLSNQVVTRPGPIDKRKHVIVSIPLA